MVAKRRLWPARPAPSTRMPAGVSGLLIYAMSDRRTLTETPMLKPLARCAAIALLALTFATPAKAQKAGGTLVWGTTQAPRHLNPAVQSGIATMMPGAQLFASPLRFDDKWNPLPYLAESWSFQDDGKSLLLKLVAGATFHDGRPITSEDVAFSIMAIKANHPFSSMLAGVDRVDTPDPRIAIIRMKEPHPAILYALGPPLAPIIPKHIYGDGADLKTHPRNISPVGSGPYKLVEFKPGEHIILEKNPTFFIKDRPKFDRVIFRIFRDTNAMAVAIERKEVQFSPFWADLALLDRLSKLPGVAATERGGEAIGPINWLAFNTKKKPLDDARVRQAISFAIDREFITKKLHGGRTKIATGPIAPGSPFYNPGVEPYKVNLERANALLDAAGLKRGANGMRIGLSIDYLPGSEEQQKNIAEYIKPQLKKVGIDVTVRASPDFPTWAKRVSGHDFDLTLDSVFNWGDPVIGVHRTYLSSNIRPGVIWSNTQSYVNPKVDELLARAAVEKDREKRKAMYMEFQKIVVSDAPIAFLNVLPYFQIHQKDLRGLPVSIWGATAPIDEMYRE
jgi:peptide/nickel transport system substrate-binding protein